MYHKNIASGLLTNVQNTHPLALGFFLEAQSIRERDFPKVNSLSNVPAKLTAVRTMPEAGNSIQVSCFRWQEHRHHLLPPTYTSAGS